MNGSPNLPLHEQFVALFVQNEAAIRSFVYTMIPSTADSEEVVQEASITMWRKFDQFQPGTSFRNWAFQIAKYTAFNYARKQSRDRHRFGERMMKLLSDQAITEQEGLEAQRRMLDLCISKLQDSDRQVLAGCYHEKATIKEFATQAGRTPNAVTKHLNRIRQSLLRCVRHALSLEGTA